MKNAQENFLAVVESSEYDVYLLKLQYFLQDQNFIKLYQCNGCINFCQNSVQCCKSVVLKKCNGC